MKKIAVHRRARQECSGSSGGAGAGSCEGWGGLGAQLLLSPERPVPATWDPGGAGLLLGWWSGREQVLILRSRRIAVFILKVCHFLCGSWISFLCYTRWELCCVALLWVIPAGCRRGRLLCYKRQMHRSILVYLLHFSSRQFDSK